MSAAAFVLEHPAGLRVSRGLTEAEVTASGLVDPGTRDRLHEWTWYGVPPFEDGGLVLSLWLGFKSGKLDAISLKTVDPQNGDDPGDWSEAKERDRAERLRLWLIAKGFPPGRYPWGTVSVAFDEKAGGVSAGVRYTS